MTHIYKQNLHESHTCRKGKSTSSCFTLVEGGDDSVFRLCVDLGESISGFAIFAGKTWNKEETQAEVSWGLPTTVPNLFSWRGKRTQTSKQLAVLLVHLTDAHEQELRVRSFTEQAVLESQPSRVQPGRSGRWSTSSSQCCVLRLTPSMTKKDLPCPRACNRRPECEMATK